MNRRDFLRYARFAGFLAGSLPLAIAACSPASDSAATSNDSGPSEAAASGNGFIPVASLADFNGEDSLLQEDTDLGSVLLVREGDEIIAVNPRCPHAGCDVAWDGDEFVCPCHDSRFQRDGAVTSGPANDGLEAYELQVDNDQVLVRAS